MSAAPAKLLAKRQGKTLRQLLWERWQRLQTERESWITHYRLISRAVLPRVGRFLDEQPNRGERKHNNIYDNTATLALRTAASGMMAGATSPARPWFRLTTPDPDLARYHTVRLWLDDVGQRMLRVYAKSNTYPAFHQLYRELLAFGTAASIQLPHPTRIVHHTPVTIGEYAIALNEDGNPDTLYRVVWRTVRQVVQEFGLTRVSQRVKNWYERGELDQWVEIIHAMEPRLDRDPSRVDNMNMEYRSVYFEPTPKDNPEVLRESGFSRFRAVVPRWDVQGGDVYGSSPGMDALGDVNQLQLEQIRKTQGIEQQTHPALQAPTSMRDSETDFLPGGLTFVDAVHPQGGVRNAYESTVNLRDLKEDIVDIRERINAAFFADLWLMLHNTRYDPKKTAYEVAELQEEKLIVLGPMLERLHADLLTPDIDMKFDAMIEANLIPPPPAELHGVDLQVEFVSLLAQAQRKIGVNDVDRFVGNLGAVAGIPGKEDVVDKFNADAWADYASQALGIDPRLIVANEQVARIRKARAQVKAVADQTALAAQQAKAAKDLAATPSTGDTAYTDLMSGLTGYNSPPAAMVGA